MPAAPPAPELEMALAHAAAPIAAAAFPSFAEAVAPATDILLPLPALRLGMRGSMVKAWQLFLIGEKLDPGEVNGIFGDQTAEATRAFQSKMKIEADGVAGRQTLRKAMERGFELIEEPAPDITGSNFPAKPSFPPMVSNAQRTAVFGSYNFLAAPLPGNKEHVRILGTWEKDNILRVPIPQLKTALGDKAPATISFHRLAAAQLQGLWKDWADAGLLDRLLNFEGGFNTRFVRGSTKTLSNHAFGSAFDINTTWNERGKRPALVGQKGSVRELVPLANKWGFWWGGHFQNPDGMHFEVAVLR